MEDKQKILDAFAARVNETCDKLGIARKNRQTELGRLFGVTQKAARKWLVGEGFPDTAICIQMALKAGVSFDWLMTGRGSPGGDMPECLDDDLFAKLEDLRQAIDQVLALVRR